MKIPNYDVNDVTTNYRQLFPFMPDQNFRMLICGPSGSGKTIVLLDMIFRLLDFDKIYLYAKNLEQSKYQLLQKIGHLNQPVKMGDMNQKPLVDYFIGSRHKNCSVVYLLQS